jgi:hypothetical protein
LETTHTETQDSGDGAARSFDLDALGLGPPTKVRRRGTIDKWTRILGVAVVLLFVFNIGVRLGHATQPKAAAPAGSGGGAGAGTGAGATGATGAGAGRRAGGAGGAGPVGGAAAPKPTAQGTVKYLDGNTIYVTLPDGTTKRVVANESTRFTRTEPSGLRDIQPGDRLNVEGSNQPDGSISAVRIEDSASTLQ